MEGSKKFFLALAIFLGMMNSGSAQSSTTLVPAVFTFGDSTMDVGNNDFLDSDFKANFLPYGRDFMNHTPTGRFCNGKLPTDFTVETLGFTTYPLPYLSPQATGKNLLIGAGFASAGSGYSDQTTKLYHAISLSQQLKYFKEYQSKLVQLVSRRKANSIIKGGLYVLGTGTGDFVQNYYINRKLRKLYSVNAFSDLLARELSKFIKGLHSLGARRIGITSLPPLGCLPANIRVFGHGRKTCVTRLNEDAKTFNRKLNQTVVALARELPNLMIAVFDIYQPIYDLATAPSKQGFVEAKRGCCKTGSSVKTSVLCIPKSTSTCSNATSYVFWDSVHPSEAANKFIAESLAIAGIYLIS
ncbi:GDSL esterase/lipase APG [Rhynchospora pubera]|uniref:GDSL esterase/lipase APG n=1 Tax=Rhynchospora pubera TaxID=906938 RepID=A0AAV8GXE9_9POAL|nr:GDSL esterase/lipase APG [Rhynchospora pubera]